jgi:anti-sigma factor RsiW
MITCCKIAELLIDYVANELPEEQRWLVEQHLKHCPACVTYLETYRLTITMTRKLPEQPVPPQLVARLKAAWTQMHPPSGPSFSA